MSDTKDFTKGGEGLSAYEPDPVTNNGPSMHDLVAEDLQGFKGPAASQQQRGAVFKVLEDVIERKQFGLDKYGTILQANNGRNPLVDAYQESHDLAVYLKQYLCEAREHDVYDKRDVKFLYKNNLKVMLTLRKLIDEQNTAT